MTEPAVCVAVPPNERYARVLRVVASSSAATAGLPMDVLGELGLAIDEAVASLLEVPEVDAIECSIQPEGHRLSVSVTGAGGNAGQWPPHGWDASLAAMVLTGVARDVTLTSSAAGPAVSFRLGGD